MDTRQLDIRRHRLTRRSALTGVAAASLVALTALAGGAAAVAAPRASSAPSRFIVTTVPVADLRLPSKAPASSTAPRPAPMRAGSCDVAMMDL